MDDSLRLDALRSLSSSTTVPYSPKLNFNSAPRTSPNVSTTANSCRLSFTLAQQSSKWYVYHLALCTDSRAISCLWELATKLGRKLETLFRHHHQTWKLTSHASTLGYHNPLHQVARPPARPRARAARQGRSQDGQRHLPPRVERQGAQRGQGPGRRPRRAGQGRQKAAHGCLERRPCADSSSM